MDEDAGETVRNALKTFLENQRHMQLFALKGQTLILPCFFIKLLCFFQHWRIDIFLTVTKLY